MVLNFLLALHATQIYAAADFNPLVQGTLWSYQSSGEQTLTILYEAGKPISFKGGEATPMWVSYHGTQLSTTYYQNTGDTAGIVADEDLSSPYSPPRPLFKIGAADQTWTYSGRVPFESGTAPISLAGSSRLGGKRAFAGKDVDTLEVTIDATLTPLKKNKKPMTQHQVAVYGRGIGLMEMTMTGSVDGVAHSQHLELIKLDHRGSPR